MSLSAWDPGLQLTVVKEQPMLSPRCTITSDSNYVNYLDDLGAAEEDSHAEEAFNCLGWILASIGIRESLKATPGLHCGLPWHTVQHNNYVPTNNSGQATRNQGTNTGVVTERYCQYQRVAESARKVEFRSKHH